MGVNSLPKTVTRQRRDCDLHPGPSVPAFSTLTTRLPSNPFPYKPFFQPYFPNLSSGVHCLILRDGVGFYTAWLLPAAVVGLLVFLYGLFSMGNDTYG